jgi:hypothetical protein
MTIRTLIVVVFCVSTQGIPRCEKCGKEGKLNWGDMSYAQQSSWVWEGESLKCKCKECFRKEKVEKIMYEKEREFYKKAKQELYPKESPKIRLRQIDSEKEWEGTASFYQPWRLPSALEKIIQPLLGDRKPTGAVGINHVDATSKPDINIADRSSSAQRRDLESFAEDEEEIEIVEEESLEGFDERSVKNGARSNTGSSGTTPDQPTRLVSVRA